MAKNRDQTRKSSKNSEEKINRSVDASATDNQNVNDGHNSKKEALGPNTKR